MLIGEIDIDRPEGNPVLVWDSLVRIFHWSLAVFFLLAYFSEGSRSELHAHAGYTVVLLLLFRIIWGLIGSQFARFREFVVWPGKSLRYFVALLRGKSESYLGHNPAGAAMIVALLLCVFLTGLSGVVLFALEGSGPLANTFVISWPGNTVEQVHEIFANLSLVLVVIHVLGVMYSSYRERENLAKSMITGTKKNRSGGQS